ncbi:uncharacterized protein LOC110838717 isoform X2 [Zootermopsis nevadensis]|uniref:uncharacterized protein LOC110838717 isoform X2 n=1 Tax=Zootermopsis nevadensis TaxID=136037 RepID=UPI000B8E481B|nr:uncharacterized protein LOC110838717 isoform X2 [Zootermopsis nevadensis]
MKPSTSLCDRFSTILTGSGVEIVICTSHGEVLEFCDRKIVGICPISCFNPKSITIFTSYDFQCNIFYIIRSENGIIILSRKRGLKVVKRYEDVERVMVSDFSNVGFPQLGIWTKNSKESVTPDKILDLQEGSNTYSDDCSISNILREKNQELSLKIEEYEHKLKVKKHLRLYNSEVTGHGNKLPFPSDSMLVLLGSQSGCRDLDPKEHLERGPSVRIAETWQKMHNGKWVVGISICNNGKSDVLDLRLILKCSSEDKVTYTTKLLMCSGEYESPSPSKRPRTSRGVAAWNEVIVLKPEGKAVLVGVLEAPKFVGNAVVSLTGAIMYKVDQEEDKGKQYLPFIC